MPWYFTEFEVLVHFGVSDVHEALPTLVFLVPGGNIVADLRATRSVDRPSRFYIPASAVHAITSSLRLGPGDTVALELVHGRTVGGTVGGGMVGGMVILEVAVKKRTTGCSTNSQSDSVAAINEALKSSTKTKAPAWIPS